jgi:uncharacterized membrane protein
VLRKKEDFSMLRFSSTITIHRPPDIVFAFLADFTHMPLWNYYVQEVTLETPAPVGVGSVYHQIRKTDQQQYQIVEYVPNQVVTMQTLPPALHLRMRLEVRPAADGTLLADTWEVTLGLPDIVERLAKRNVQRAVEANLEVLRRLLEDGKATLPDGRQVTYPR